MSEIIKLSEVKITHLFPEWTQIDDNDDSTYPEEDAFVLVNFADGRIGVCCYCKDYPDTSAYWYNFWTTERYTHIDDRLWWQDRIVAWMPLPDSLRGET